MSQGLINRLTRHQIQIQRFAGGQIREVMPILRDLSDEIRARIAREDLTAFQRQRAESIQGDIESLTNDAQRQMRQQLQLRDFADQERNFAREALAASVATDLSEGISIDQLMASITRAPMTLTSGQNVRELTLDEAFQEFAGAMSRDVRRQIQLGVTEGQTVEEMARNARSLVRNRSRKQAESLVRTAVNHTGSMAREQLYQDNADILKGEKWVSTLDGKTSAVCRARDGQIFPVGEGPQTPAHFGCRSLRVPEVRDEFRIQAKGERASMDGPVSNQKTYGGFLRDQGAEFQDDVLGRARGRLFREGKVSIDQFVDDQGRSLTLEQLAQRNNFDLSEFR